ncbi:MAG: hypothetical protein ACI9YB_000446 [Halioglobus sp.]|jgi:hypothetical protein
MDMNMNDVSAQIETYLSETTANNEQILARELIKDEFENSPLPVNDLLFNLGLYTRSSLLVKFLVMNDLYERIKDLPGSIMEFGVWYGQNMVLLENLRAIHEPFNKQRSIIGFDTFSGYENFSEKDASSNAFQEGAYTTPKGYEKDLEKLLRAHEKSNVLGHLKSQHKLIKGDVEKTAAQYFKDFPETIVAMAYFDMGNYVPTKSALEAIKPHLLTGSVILFDQLTWEDAPGEAIAFKEVFNDMDYKIEKSHFYPSKAIVTIK